MHVYIVSNTWQGGHQRRGLEHAFSRIDFILDMTRVLVELSYTSLMSPCKGLALEAILGELVVYHGLLPLELQWPPMPRNDTSHDIDTRDIRMGVYSSCITLTIANSYSCSDT